MCQGIACRPKALLSTDRPLTKHKHVEALMGEAVNNPKPVAHAQVSSWWRALRVMVKNLQEDSDSSLHSTHAFN